MKILLTGYEPFGGEPINPALKSVQRLHGQVIDGAEVVSVELPVGWERALPAFAAAVAEHQPDAVISVGQAGGRAKICPEYIGINLMNGKDNYDIVQREENIVPDGPDGYFATLPVTRMVAAMREQNIPAAISYSAGTYLCNYMAYMARHYAVTHNLHYKSCFIHIPYLPEQVVNKSAGIPSMPLDLIVAGLTQCIRVAVADAK